MYDSVECNLTDHRLGNVGLVEALIKAGADVKAANTKTGATPLHMALHARGPYQIGFSIMFN